MNKLIRVVFVLTSAILVLFVPATSEGQDHAPSHSMPHGGTFTGFYTTTFQNIHRSDSSDNRPCDIGGVTLPNASLTSTRVMFGAVDMVQTGDHVTGEFLSERNDFDRANGTHETQEYISGRFEGTVRGNHLNFQWTSNDGHQGSGNFDLRTVEDYTAWIPAVSARPLPLGYDGFVLVGRFYEVASSCFDDLFDVIQMRRSYLHNPAGRFALSQTSMQDRAARAQAGQTTANQNGRAGPVAVASGHQDEQQRQREVERQDEQQRQREAERRRAELERRRADRSRSAERPRDVRADYEEALLIMAANSAASHDRLMAGISQSTQNGGAQIQTAIAENGVRAEQQRQIVRDQLRQQAEQRADQQRQQAEQQRQVVRDQLRQQADQSADQQRQQAAQQVERQRQQEADRRMQEDRRRASDTQQRIAASHASTPLGGSAPRDMTYCTSMTVRSLPAGAVTACGQYGEIRVSLHNNCTERVTCMLEFPGNEENNSSEVQAIPAAGTPVSGPGDGTYQCYRRRAPSSSIVHATCHTTCTGGQEYRGMGICACPSRTDEINRLCYPVCPSGSHRSGTNCVAD